MHKPVPSGKYIIGVSGGVDSMALLDMLSGQGDIQLIVAHVNHGMRPDSKQDAILVESTVKKYGFPFELSEADLGADASEELARDTRYNFFKILKAKHSADGVITAHHADDALETAIINISRGTGRHGLSSLSSTKSLCRPLLGVAKEDIISYANDNKILWREDKTNTDTKHLRNHIRHNVLGSASNTQKKMLNGLIDTTKDLNLKIDTEMAQYLTRVSYRREGLVFSRFWFNKLPHDLACSIAHFWLRDLKIKDYDKTFIERLVLLLKTAKPGSSFDIGGGQTVSVTKRSIRLPKLGLRSRIENL